MTTTPSAPGRFAAELAPGHHTAARELVDSATALNLAIATTDVDESTLRRARDLLDGVTAELGRQRRGRAVRAGFDAPAEARAAGLPYRVCALNPWGVPLEVHLGDTQAHATLTANALHEGPLDSVHGGVGAWLMDTMLGLIMQVQGRRAVTARLEIDYRRRTPLDQPLSLAARIVGREGRKTWIEGEIEHDGLTTLEARGLFIEVDPGVRA